MVRYGWGMIETAVHSEDPASIEATMRSELALGDSSVEGVVPILRHLLASDGNALFSEEIVARVRGMAKAIVAQLLETATTGEGETHEGAASDAQALDEAARIAVTDALVNNTAFLRHIHALALEWQLTDRLQSRLGVDPVVSPLLQSQIASSDAGISTLAMKLLASQARFCQAQRRMSHSVLELPRNLFDSVIAAAKEAAPLSGANTLPETIASLQASYDEAATRLGLISTLLGAMGGEAASALSVVHSGPAIFLSAMAQGAGLGRDASVLATNEAQCARLALALRAAGLKPAGIEEQFVALHPDVTLPEGFERLNADRAAALLAVAGDRHGA